MIQKRVSVIFLLLALLTALFLMLQRMRIEAANRQVELVLDYDNVLEFVQREGVSLPDVLKELKSGGVSTIALPEATLNRLVLMGRIRVWTGEDLLRTADVSPLRQKGLAWLLKEHRVVSNYLYVISDDQEILAWVRGGLAHLLGKGRVRPFRGGLEVVGKGDEVRTMGLGFLQDDGKFLSSLGFLTAPRIENRDNLTEEKIKYLFSGLKGFPLSVMIFSGMRSEVLGYPDLIGVTAEQMRSLGLAFGSVEVYEASRVQKGTESLARLLSASTVKVQTILPLQFAKLSPEKAVAIWKLGTRERNVRVLYMRLFPSGFLRENGSLSTPMETNNEYVRQLLLGLKSQGFTVGRVSGINAFPPGLLPLLLLTLGLVGALILFGETFFSVPAPVAALLLLGGGIGAAASSILGLAGMWSKLIALGFALLFPLWGLTQAFLAPPPSIGKIPAAYLLLARATLITLLGGVLASSTLFGSLSFLGIAQFRGVKAILLFPVVMTPLLYLAGARQSTVLSDDESGGVTGASPPPAGSGSSRRGRSIPLFRSLGGEKSSELQALVEASTDSQSLAERSKITGSEEHSGVRPEDSVPRESGIPTQGGTLVQFVRRLVSLMKTAIPVWAGVLVLGCIGAVGLYMLRSGNTAGEVAAPEWERMLRGGLEQIFLVRPRFKEFFFGHPAFLLAALFHLHGLRAPAAWLLVAGSVGQASLLDSFAHLHTPVWVTLLRSFHGLWIGGVLVFPFLFFLQRYAARMRWAVK